MKAAKTSDTSAASEEERAMATAELLSSLAAEAAGEEAGSEAARAS